MVGLCMALTGCIARAGTRGHTAHGSARQVLHGRPAYGSDQAIHRGEQSHRQPRRLPAGGARGGPPPAQAGVRAHQEGRVRHHAAVRAGGARDRRDQGARRADRGADRARERARAGGRQGGIPRERSRTETRAAWRSTRRCTAWSTNPSCTCSSTAHRGYTTSPSTTRTSRNSRVVPDCGDVAACKQHRAQRDLMRFGHRLQGSEITTARPTPRRSRSGCR